MADHDWRAQARQIADNTLFPAALDVDHGRRTPKANLDLLAEHGFYGVAAPEEFGGVGVTGFDVIADVVIALAGGCLTTTFVGLQHVGPVMAVAASPSEQIRDSWLGPLCRGERRAGIALAGLRPGPSQVSVRAAPGGFLVSGETAWVTGWGLIDTLFLAAKDAAGQIHFLLLDAATSPTLTVGPTDLLAVQSSGTVTVRFDEHFVPAERLTHTQSYDDWAGADSFGSSLNGFLALGITDRCLRLLDEPGHLDQECAEARTGLLTAQAEQIPAARSRASLLAVRAATTLLVKSGSRGVLLNHHAQRLYREAGFLLVFGSRPAIKQELLFQLASADPT